MFNCATRIAPLIILLSNQFQTRTTISSVSRPPVIMYTRVRARFRATRTGNSRISLFFFFFLQSVHMYPRVYSNHREPIYISLFPCKSRPRVPRITTRDRSTLKYKDVNTGQRRGTSRRERKKREEEPKLAVIPRMNVLHEERNESFPN